MNIVNETIVKKILTSNDPHSQIQVLKWGISNNIVAAGTNYASEVSRLTISYQKDGTEKKKVLFLKAPINSPSYESFKKYDPYEKEMLIYTEVLPQIYTIEDEYFTPRHYFIDDEMSIFLKDLSLSGYKMVNRLDQLDVEHACYALKCLAKFHGLSVQVEKTVGLPDKIKTHSLFQPDNGLTEGAKFYLNGIPMFIDNLGTDIKRKYPQQVAAFENITWESVVEDTSPKCSSFNVLNHGDFWTNNMMFKYDKYGILKKVKILDFQLCGWGNPALDLIQFFITSVKFEVYEKYSDLLLDIYLNTLNKVLKTLGCATYELEELINDIESRFNFAHVILSCGLSFVMSDPNDPIDIGEMCKNGEIEMNSTSKAYKQENFIKLSTKWFIHFAEKGILGNKNKENGFSTDELTYTMDSTEP